MEEVLRAIAPKNSNGRQQTHHTQAGLPVCCEQALKSVGERNVHTGNRPRESEGSNTQHLGLRGGAKREARSAKWLWLCRLCLLSGSACKGCGSRIDSRRTTSFCTNGCFCEHHMWVDKT
jgi:hypothetical protein